MRAMPKYPYSLGATWDGRGVNFEKDFECFAQQRIEMNP